MHHQMKLWGSLALPNELKGFLAPRNELKGLLAPPNELKGLLAPPNDLKGLLAPPNELKGLLTNHFGADDDGFVAQVFGDWSDNHSIFFGGRLQQNFLRHRHAGHWLSDP